MEKTELIQKAKLAEQAERYDDMTTCMKGLTEQGAELSNEERQPAVGGLQERGRGPPVRLRVIFSIEQKTDTSDKKLQLTGALSRESGVRAESICTTVLELLDKYVIANATNPESKVFYLKMKEITSGTLLKLLVEMIGNKR